MGQGSNLPSIGQVGVADVLRFQHKRIVTDLFVRFLQVIENLQSDHDDAMFKLQEKLPHEYKDYVDLIDYWSESRMETMRKAILDEGNRAIRQLDEQLENYDIEIKSSKGRIIS